MNHPKTYVTCAFVAFSALFTGACETSTEPANINHPKSSEDTDLWAGDIIELQAEQFFNSDFMRSYESQLIASYGAEIVATASQWNAKNYSREDDVESSMETSMLLESMPHKPSNRQTNTPTRIRILHAEDTSQDFVMAMTMYGGEPQSQSNSKREWHTRHKKQDESYYSFMSPDRFYANTNSDGVEEWPITVQAQSLENSNDEITLVFNKDGLLWNQLDDHAFAVANSGKLIMLDAISVVENGCETITKLEDYQACMEETESEESHASEQGEWAAKQTPKTNFGRGMDPGRYQPNSLYLVLKSLRIPFTGDGDGLAELQMFMDAADDRTFPLRHRYRFDRVYSYNPIFGWSYNTIIEGADKYFPYYRYYKVPDINYKNRRYTFKNIIRYQTLGNPNNHQHYPSYVDYFPLINFSQVFGDWELVLVDDDNMYTHFSRRRVGSTFFTKLLKSFNLELEIVEEIERRFTNMTHLFGSSDDVLVNTGVHQINSKTTQNILGREYVTRVVAQNGRTAEYGFSGIID